MIPDLVDTIVALATPSGSGLRAIVRLSGPASWKIAAAGFDDLPAESGRRRLFTSGLLRLPNVLSPLPTDLYFWPKPASYTGQDMAELHTISSPPLVDLVVAQCLHAGARAAQPGEFTMRAFLAGKRDLPRAEAVLGVIHARSRDELKHALAQLAGGLAQPVAQLREDLLNLLADVEAGLDFSEEDLSFVGTEDLLKRLAHGLAVLTLVGKQIDQRSTSTRPFRAVLAGPVNAGKSSLFNALVGRGAALVSDQPGTTRDFLCSVLVCDDVRIELLDTAGLRSVDEGAEAVEEAAQALGIEQVRDADLVLWCEAGRAEPREGPDDGEPEHEIRPIPGLGSPDILRIATKCDLAPAPDGSHATSSASGLGLDRLRQLLAERARAQAHAGLAPSLSRCRHHVDACLEHLRRAHLGVLQCDPAEIQAMEIRLALDELGAMVGSIYTDDLLDRIFSRFCIGK